MRPASAASAFRNQVRTIQTWFTEWNDCERTIALYSLLQQMKPIHARFLSVVMEHTFRDESYRTQMYEDQANDKEFLSSLSSKSKDDVVRQLLVHLPLLRPGNPVARKEYLNILPTVLSHSHKLGVHKDECRQLLSLALVHPAFPPDERNQLHQWLQVLDEKLVESIPSPGNNSLPGYYDPKTTEYTQSNNKSWRHAQLEKRDSGLGNSFDHHNNPSYFSMSLPPNPPNLHNKIMKSQSLNSGVGNIKRQAATNGVNELTGESSVIVNRTERSLSFPVDPQKLHKPLSPQSSVESETDDINTMKMSNYSENNRPGMKDYFLWLKGLRLHKYASLFAKISYDEMFELKDADLGAKNVTKGAKTKILISVQKLTERSQTLCRLEKEVHEEGKLPSVLESLKSILQTPIKPFVPAQSVDVVTSAGVDTGEEGGADGGADGGAKVNAEYAPNPPSTHPDDLPSQLTKVIGKACTQLLVSKPNEENFAVYISLLEKALNKEAFTQTQKKRLQSWKQQCQMSAKRFSIRRGSQDRGRLFDTSSMGANAKRQQRGPQRPQNKLAVSISHGGPVTSSRSYTTENYYKSKHMRNPHALVSRTKSAPIPASNKRPPMLGLPHQASIDSVEGIDDSLESLCLSMTEHALADNTD